MSLSLIFGNEFGKSGDSYKRDEVNKLQIYFHELVLEL